MNETLWVLLALFTKHLVIDFPLQVRYQYSNKGTYGHPGGLLHSGLHALGTFALALLFPGSIGLWLGLALMDGVIHYHLDWAKVQLNKRLNWGPTTHEQFWWLLGADQYLHTLTYLLIAALINNYA